MADDLGRSIALIDDHLPYLHRQRWLETTSRIREEIRNSTGAEREAAERRMSEHYKLQFNSASSRDAIIEEVRAGRKKLKAGSPV